MADTGQPLAAPETEPVSKDDALAQAADAFKVSLGQMDAPGQPRAPDGKFASPNPAPETAADGGEEIEGEDAPEAGADALESQEDGQEEAEAAEEAQPETLPLPTSWPAEQEEKWRSLPPETQAFIAQREGQRDAAVGQKFQEAATARAEAQANRDEYGRAIDQVIGLIMPPLSMLDVNSSDYDPDRYHLTRAQLTGEGGLISQLTAQRQQIAAQQQQEAQQADHQRFLAIQQRTAPAFVRDVPDITDQAKAPVLIQGLMDYAVSLGAPPDVFSTPTTAVEWHVLWKAREYDKQQAAQAKVKSDPAPEPRKPSPPVRPGVATPPSARAAARRQQNFDRLSRSGSIQDGAAVFKDFLKGT